MASSKTTKSDAPVAAREQLNQQDGGDVDPRERLEEQAKEQEKQQADALKEGAKAKAGAHQENIDNDNVAGARVSAGFNGSGAQAGFVDQLSRRSASDALEGHFVRIDLNAKGVQDALKRVQGLTDDDGNLVDDVDYGVYLTPGELDKDTGYPLTATVVLRGVNGGAHVTVPYEALRHTTAGRA